MFYETVGFSFLLLAVSLLSIPFPPRKTDMACWIPVCGKLGGGIGGLLVTDASTLLLPALGFSCEEDRFLGLVCLVDDDGNVSFSVSYSVSVAMSVYV